MRKCHRVSAGIAAASIAFASNAFAAPGTIDKGDTAWMLVSTALVVLMIVPGWRCSTAAGALQKHPVDADAGAGGPIAGGVVWVAYGYSLAFVGESIIGGFDKLFLAGIGPDTPTNTFSAGVQIPELVYVAFQGAFAAISCALVVGAIAERAKFSAVLLFTVVWFTFAYLPLAHMVWAGNGYLFALGALDFAGGTVVHINAGVAGLVGAYMLGPRIGFGRERLSPHSLP